MTSAIDLKQLTPPLVTNLARNIKTYHELESFPRKLEFYKQFRSRSVSVLVWGENTKFRRMKDC